MRIQHSYSQFIDVNTIRLHFNSEMLNNMIKGPWSLERKPTKNRNIIDNKDQSIICLSILSVYYEMSVAMFSCTLLCYLLLLQSQNCGPLVLE